MTAVTADEVVFEALALLNDLIDVELSLEQQAQEQRGDRVGLAVEVDVRERLRYQRVG